MTLEQVAADLVQSTPLLPDPLLTSADHPIGYLRPEQETEGEDRATDECRQAEAKAHVGALVRDQGIHRHEDGHSARAPMLDPGHSAIPS
ncbi:hypothetical protein [Saccharothrix sp. NRRL B-16348]|uniref:hypothetical protein n=1 Tax=Saccharothrix sp. NRRL B-16348 TaxID=1415542 RepID=UPI0012FA97D5|nr:hypothetical protein [Saccharothrix sp. NRRL B-16348]